ncbi:MAG: hypothetical protein GYB66_16680 [Chloroflexi bacterium]|nr:hypothetical protein [Chloroflexota bacterium]
MRKQTQNLTTGAWLRQILLLTIAIALFSGPQIVAAQDGTPHPPTPTEEDPVRIESVRAIVALPTVVSFRVRVTVPHSEVDQVSLTIEQDSGVDQSFELALDDSIFLDFGDEIEYEYNWFPAPEDRLRFFQPLDYRFEVTLNDGTMLTASDSIDVEHQIISDWQSAQTDLVKLYWSDDRSFDGEGQLSDLSEVLALIRRYIDVDTPLQIVVYAPDDRFCQEVPRPITEGTTATPGPPELVVMSDGRPFPCNPDALFMLYRASGFVPLQPAIPDYYTVHRALVDALFAHTYGEHWQDAQVPAWFREGIGALLSLRGRRGALGDVRQAAQIGRLLRLPQMENSPPASWNEDQIALWHNQAYLLTLYLAEIYGADAPFEIAAAIGPQTTFDAALAAISETDIQRLYARWELWLNQPRAEEAAQWNPYLPTTATPTLTRTPSPIPPTRTPRPTVTISLTPTREPLYNPTTPPAPTIALPTRRPTTSPTPLPPGYFDTPTAVTDSGGVGDDDSSNGLCGTGIGVLILPVIGLLMARRKRNQSTR